MLIASDDEACVHDARQSPTSTLYTASSKVPNWIVCEGFMDDDHDDDSGGDDHNGL